METKKLNYRRENCHFKFLGYFKNYPSCFSHEIPTSVTNWLNKIQT